MKKKIVIIGGGVAGLSAGIYGRLNGFETEIVEMHRIAGGQCTAWERKGYRFDYCLHWLVGTKNGPFHDIWKETGVLGEDVQIIDHRIHTKIYSPDGKEFIIYTNLDEWERYLCSIAPEDETKIRKMCSDMRKSSALSPNPYPPGLKRMLSGMSSVIDLMPILPILLKYGKKNCVEYFRDLQFTNKDLRYFLENIFGLNDFSALAFIMMFAWFNQKNAGYLIGGSLTLARRMTKKYTDLGGVLTFGKRVEKIIVENETAKGVVLTDGTEIRSDYVISAADGHSTIFDMLGGRYSSKKIKNAYENWPLFTSMVQVSFGISKMIESETPVETILADNLTIGSTKCEHGYSIMNYFFDPSMAPEGKTTLILRFESDWENWKKISPADYKNEKEKIENDAIKLLEKRYPGILEYIEAIDVATPLTDIRYTGVWKGSYEGFLPTSKNLMSNIDLAIPGLNNFYMAGQWLSPGGGLPPAGQTGKWAISYVCRKEKQKFVTG